MSNPGTKPKGATSYKETAFGIIPRAKLLQLVIEGTKKGLEYIGEVITKDKNTPITPELISKLHDISFAVFPNSVMLVKCSFSDVGRGSTVIYFDKSTIS